MLVCVNSRVLGRAVQPKLLICTVNSRQSGTVSESLFARSLLLGQSVHVSGKGVGHGKAGM